MFLSFFVGVEIKSPEKGWPCADVNNWAHKNEKRHNLEINTFNNIIHANISAERFGEH